MCVGATRACVSSLSPRRSRGLGTAASAALAAAACPVAPPGLLDGLRGADCLPDALDAHPLLLQRRHVPAVTGRGRHVNMVRRGLVVLVGWGQAVGVQDWGDLRG